MTSTAVRATAWAASSVLRCAVRVSVKAAKSRVCSAVPAPPMLYTGWIDGTTCDTLPRSVEAEKFSVDFENSRPSFCEFSRNNSTRVLLDTTSL